MDNRSIGVFDSGLGGLTAVKQIMRELPCESIVYFGDTARVPYGNREKDDIVGLSLQDARFLRSKGVKALLIACNTITCNAGEELCADNPDVPVVGTVDAAAAAAAAVTKNQRIGVIATNATIRSGAYEAALKALLPDAAVTGQGCPKLVPLIESNHILPGDALIEEAAAEYLAPLKAAGVDVVILGCTHYPLIAQVVRNYMGEGVELIDSGAESAKAIIKTLTATGGLAQSDAKAEVDYYCSANLPQFAAVAQVFLDQDIRAKAAEINIDEY